jgi:hypothetical protein
LFRESSQQLVERVCRFCFVPSDFVFLYFASRRKKAPQNLVTATDFGKHAGKVSPEGVHFATGVLLPRAQWLKLERFVCCRLKRCLVFPIFMLRFFSSVFLCCCGLVSCFFLATGVPNSIDFRARTFELFATSLSFFFPLAAAVVPGLCDS